MAHVIVLDSLDDDIFVCGFCKTVFNSLQVFLDHKRINCNLSGIQLKSNDIVNNAQQMASDEGLVLNDNPPILVSDQTWLNDLNCSVCKKKFKKMKSLLVHLKTHSEKPYQCPICGRCFIQNSHLQRHILTHKMWPGGCNETTVKSPETDLLSYSCRYCNSVLSNYSQYKSHMKNHLSLKKYKCVQAECIEFFDTVEQLISHVSIAHNHLEFNCHICSATFNTLEDTAVHQQNHNDTNSQLQDVKLKQYKCPKCDASFKKFDKLSLHLLMDNHQKVCIHCNKTFASDKRLRLHLQTHRKLKPYECNICKSSFHMKKYLSSHMLKHGSSQFKCAVCKSMFKRQDLLQRHMRLHQPKKMYKCPFQDISDCKKEFSRSDKLKSHIKCHTKHTSMPKMRINNNNGSVDGSTCL